MIVAGYDIGSRTSKAVILKEGEILSSEVISSGVRPAECAEEVKNLVLSQANIKMDDISFTVATGYGREMVGFANSYESEIVCHARGALWNNPAARMIIDIGGQDAKAIKIDEKGKVVKYVYNDKCASGTGRFLEVMAEALDVELEAMGALAEEATEEITLSNQCVIFAETEVISLINEGKATPDIINGLHRAMANRVAALARGIRIKEDVVMSGGVARNQGLFKALAEGLKIDLKMLEKSDPQINGALGAALMAEEKLMG